MKYNIAAKIVLISEYLIFILFKSLFNPDLFYMKIRESAGCNDTLSNCKYSLN